jgi:hypothetical protein
MVGSDVLIARESWSVVFSGPTLSQEGYMLEEEHGDAADIYVKLCDVVVKSNLSEEDKIRGRPRVQLWLFWYRCGFELRMEIITLHNTSNVDRDSVCIGLA